MSGDPLASAELFDPGTGTFSPTGSMTDARDGAGAAVLQDGSVLIAGCGSISELYDPVAGTFSTAPPTSIISYPKLALLRDGKVLAESFGNAETYDPFTRTFTMTANLPVLRSGEVVAQLPGVVILIGGWSSATNAAVDVIETFQESTQLFQTTGHLMTRRNGHTATTISQRKILITGGFHEPDNEAMASAEIYELPPRPGRNRAVRN